MAKIENFQVIKNDRPRQEVVNFLHRMVEEIKDKPVQGIAIVAINADESTSSGWSGGNYNSTRLIGAIEELKKQFMEG